MLNGDKTKDELIVELQSRLAEAEETLYAIQNGEIDAIVTPQGSNDSKVYTLESADTLYRNIVQEMGEGVATLTMDNTILYGNVQLANIMKLPLEKLIGQNLIDFIPSDDLEKYKKIFNNGLKRESKGEITIKSSDGTFLPVQIAINTIKDLKGVYAVITDLSTYKHNEELKNTQEELNKSLKALSKSEENYKRILENLQDAYIRADKDGNIIMTSPSAVRMYRYNSSSDMLGVSANSLYKNQESRDQLIKQLYKNGFVEDFEIEALRKDGTSFSASVNSQFHYDDNGQIQGTEAFVRDFTERKKAEESIQKLANLVESSEDAIITKSLNGTITSWNKGAETIYGYSADEIIGSNISILAPKNLKLEIDELIEDIKQGKKVHHYETVRIRKDGRLINISITLSPIYIKGQLVGISTIARDITQSKKVEAELKRYRGQLENLVKERTVELESAYKSLKESQEHYLTLFNSIDEGFCTVEVIFDENNYPVDYRFLEVNPAFEKQTGLIDAKNNLMRDMASDHEDYWFEIYGKVALTGKPIRFVNEAKQLNRWYYVYAFKVGNPENREVAILFSDITKFKESENKLKNYQHTLEKQVKERTKELTRSNSELEHFAYVASHDLREPLRMITSFLQLLERKYDDKLDKDAHEFIGFAVDGAKRLNNMINDLLEYSQVTSKDKEFKPIDSEQILEETLINLKVPIDENKAVISHDPLPTIVGDKEILVELFQNLISNSIKYHGNDPPKIQVSAKEENNHHCFSIKDNGIGMSNDHLERIFTIFQRLHGQDEYEGTGIGLSIAQKIVHEHGGQIWVESQEGKGSTFYFTIPIQQYQ
jgi:PAS domain S-box-containing protein